MRDLSGLEKDIITYEKSLHLPPTIYKGRTLKNDQQLKMALAEINPALAGERFVHVKKLLLEVAAGARYIFYENLYFDWSGNNHNITGYLICLENAGFGECQIRTVNVRRHWLGFKIDERPTFDSLFEPTTQEEK